MCSVTDSEKNVVSKWTGIVKLCFLLLFCKVFLSSKAMVSEEDSGSIELAGYENMARFSPVQCQFFPNQTISRTVRILTIQCTKCRYLHTNNKQCDGKKSYLLPKKKKRFMSSHLCFNERFSLELHVNPLTHNRVCCCQMRLENGIFILLEQAKLDQ